ncbi:MAG: DUF479 domain-containing protein [Pseudomonadales bacterium]|nr:DUF479 domain-containing protein [Pseudomonadales bacterium]
MNHLAHFKAGYPEPSLIAGGLLADHVKGRLKGVFPEPVERGIRLHRAIDAFADSHVVTRRSARRFSPPFRRYGSIMVDIIYDHFLARHWDDFCEPPLTSFCDDVFEALDDKLIRSPGIPDATQRVARRMIDHRSLEGYRDEPFIDRSLSWLGTRLRRENPLDRGFAEFDRHREELFGDFALFYIDLEAFVAAWRADNEP